MWEITRLALFEWRTIYLLAVCAHRAPVARSFVRLLSRSAFLSVSAETICLFTLTCSIYTISLFPFLDESNSVNMILHWRLFSALGQKGFCGYLQRKKKKQRFKVELFFFHFKDTPAVNIFHYQNVFDMFIGKKVSKLQASGWLLPDVCSRACWESHSLWGFGFILNRCVKGL